MGLHGLFVAGIAIYYNVFLAARGTVLGWCSTVYTLDNVGASTSHKPMGLHGLFVAGIAIYYSVFLAQLHFL
jgi:hypothetical protein